MGLLNKQSHYTIIRAITMIKRLDITEAAAALIHVLEEKHGPLP